MLRIAVATAMLAMSAVFAHASDNCVGPLSIPQTPGFASANGFNTLSFLSHFGAAVDVSPDGVQQAQWYRGFPGDVYVPPVGDLTAVPCPQGSLNPLSHLQITKRVPSLDSGQTWLSTFNCGRNASGVCNVDLTKTQVFNLGYFEAEVYFDPEPIPGGDRQQFSSLFLMSAEHFVGLDTIPGGKRWCEIDWIEQDAGGALGQPQAHVGTVHRWTYTNATGQTTNEQNSNFWTWMASNFHWAGWHKIGLLWTASTISWTVDGVVIKSWPTPDVCKTQALFLTIGAQARLPQTHSVSERIRYLAYWR